MHESIISGSGINTDDDVNHSIVRERTQMQKKENHAHYPIRNH